MGAYAPLLAGLLLGPLGCTDAPRPPPRPDAPGPPAVTWNTGVKIGGVSFSAPRREMPAGALDPIVRLGAGWIAVIPYAFVDPADPVVVFDRERQFWGETAHGVAETITAAHAAGLRVLLKPHLWVRGQGWPGEFAPTSVDGWMTFLDTYGEYIGRFAAIADSLDVDMLAVGTEVDMVAVERPEYWRGLIWELRRAYGGALTYAANWDEYGNIGFWDALDLIGVDAYFPLMGGDTPDADDLVRAWDRWAAELERTAGAYDRPILFTEFGYRSIDGAAGEHWELPEGRDALGLPPNEDVQAAAYEALFRVWWERPDFAGGFVWNWHPGTPDRDRIGTDFSPQGKRAEGVIARWFRATEGGSFRAR